MGRIKRNDRSRRQRPRIRLIPRISREALGILLLVVATVTLLALLFPAALTRDLSNAVRLVFGWASFALPVLIGAFGLALLWSRVDEEYHLRASEMAGWVLAYLFLLSAGHLIGVLINADSLAMGVAGESLTQFLNFGLGTVGALLATLAMGVAGFMLSLSIGVSEAWLAIASLWSSLSGWVRERVSPSFRVNRPEVYRETPKLKVPVLSRNGRPPEPPKIAPVAGKPSARPETGRPMRSGPPNSWQLPPVTLLQPPSGSGELSQAEIRQKVRLIEDTLADFGVQARVLEVNPGPTVTQFGLEPGFHERYDRNGMLLKREKVKVSEITSLSNDLALALAAPSIRIEAPVPGRTVVGIEVPNSTSSLVSLRGVIETPAFQKVKSKSKLAIALGQDVSGQPIVADLARMPHVLIAGATGSGKSVCINSIVACLLLHSTPEELRLLMIDPKRVELTTYNDVPHLLTPVVVEVERAVGALTLMLREMEDRYKKFQKAGVRDIERYNKQLGRNSREALPYIVVIIDELADLMMTSPEEIERTLCRLAQMARATGIHLVVATQRPSVDVVTGLIKANIPTRISFAVTSQVDSRTILDMVGAEKLLGRGDMLFMPTDAAKPYRLQGTYVSDEEIEEIVGFWKAQGPVNYVEAFANASIEHGSDGTTDELYDKALELARQHTRISTSLLQRRLRIGYARAARLIDTMEEAGIVGPSEGGKSREVLITRVPAVDSGENGEERLWYGTEGGGSQ